MKSIAVRTTESNWESAGTLYGPGARTNGHDLVQVKILSDRRSEGGGIAFLVKFSPPPEKLLKLVAVARSDEHVYILEGGYYNRRGEQIKFAGDYGLNPKGHPHSAFVGRETVGLNIYSGEPDEVRELAIVDPLPAESTWN